MKFAYYKNLCKFIILLLCINNCGFNPIYKKNDKKLAICNVEVQQIPGIDGAEIYYHLSRMISSNCEKQNKKYKLISTIRTNTTPIVIMKNSDILRQSITQYIDLQLVNLCTSDVIFTKTITSNSSYDDYTSIYESYIDKESLLVNMAIYNAERIVSILISFLQKYESISKSNK